MKELEFNLNESDKYEINYMIEEIEKYPELQAHFAEGDLDQIRQFFEGDSTQKNMIKLFYLSGYDLKTIFNFFPYSSFRADNGLISIVIPNARKGYIDARAFRNCQNLESVTISNGIDSIGEEAFYNCDNLKEINFPNNQMALGRNVFWSCGNLETISLPDIVDGKLPRGTLGYCKNLKNVTLPSNTKEIDSYALTSCESLKNIVLPDKVETILSGAFEDCDNLETITLPRSLKQIGGMIFEHDYKLNQIIYKGTKEEWQEIQKPKTWNLDYATGVTLDINIICSDGIIESGGKN